MTVAELQTERALIQTAITNTLTGNASSYGVNGRSVTRLDLSTLYARLREIDVAIARLSGTGTFSVANFRRDN